MMMQRIRRWINAVARLLGLRPPFTAPIRYEIDLRADGERVRDTQQAAYRFEAYPELIEHGNLSVELARLGRTTTGQEAVSTLQQLLREGHELTDQGSTYKLEATGEYVDRGHVPAGARTQHTILRGTIAPTS